MRAGVSSILLGLVLTTAAVVVAQEKEKKNEAKVEEVCRLKVGQWAMTRTKTLAEGGEWRASATLYVWVERIEGKTAFIKLQDLTADGLGMAAAIESSRDVEAKSPPRAAGTVTKTSEETLDIGGKKVKCERIETHDEKETSGKKLGKTTITWTSTEIPALAECARRVLMEAGKETFRYEVTDFGDTGGSERPHSMGGPR